MSCGFTLAQRCSSGTMPTSDVFRWEKLLFGKTGITALVRYIPEGAYPFTIIYRAFTPTFRKKSELTCERVNGFGNMAGGQIKKPCGGCIIGRHNVLRLPWCPASQAASATGQARARSATMNVQTAKPVITGVAAFLFWFFFLSRLLVHHELVQVFSIFHTRIYTWYSISCNCGGVEKHRSHEDKFIFSCRFLFHSYFNFTMFIPYNIRAWESRLLYDWRH